MTVQTAEIIRDRILNVDYGHKLAVFRLPPFIRGDGEMLRHNGFKYTRDYMHTWFDAFFDDMVVSGEIIKRGHNRGGKLIGVYNAKEVAMFDEAIYKIKLST